MIQIDHDIPAPPRRTGRPPKYPFRSMQANDSFRIALSEVTPHITLEALNGLKATIRVSVSRAQGRYGGVFTWAQDGDGVRVWCVEPVDAINRVNSSEVTASAGSTVQIGEDS